MKKLHSFLLLVIFIGLTISCKQEDTPSLNNPNVVSFQLDTVLKNYYPRPSVSADSEILFRTSFANGANGFEINMNWFGDASQDGIYMHFNNNVGDVLIDANGFIKSFDSGIKIDSALNGIWSGNMDGRIAYDYILYPSANKGNLAGQGDKYIIFRVFSDLLPAFKYYGYMRIKISADGRETKIISVAYQKNPNTGFLTGEY